MGFFLSPGVLYSPLFSARASKMDHDRNILVSSLCPVLIPKGIFIICNLVPHAEEPAVAEGTACVGSILADLLTPTSFSYGGSLSYLTDDSHSNLSFIYRVYTLKKDLRGPF